jgi:hypothetical protein
MNQPVISVNKEYRGLKHTVRQEVYQEVSQLIEQQFAAQQKEIDALKGEL